MTDLSDSGQADTIEITPEMVDAEVAALCGHDFGDLHASFVEDIYLMMEVERRSERDSSDKVS